MLKSTVWGKRRLTIANKIYGGFLIAIVCILLLLGFIFHSLKSLNASYNEIIDYNMAVLVHMESIQINAVQLNNSFSNYLLNKNKESLKEIDAASADIVVRAQAALGMLNNTEDSEKLNALLGWNAQYLEKIAELNGMEAGQANSYANTRIFPLAKLIRTNANILAQKQEEAMAAEVLASDQQVKRTNVFMLIGSILLVAATMLLGTLLSRNISVPIRRLSLLAETVAGGDLRSSALHIRNKDEIGSLAESFISMRSGLQKMIQKVSEAAGQLSISSEELREGAKQTSAATTYIVESIQQVAASAENQQQGTQAISASMDEIVKAIGSITSNVSVISETSGQAINIVDDGHAYMEHTSRDMGSIDQVVDETSRFMDDLRESVLQIERIVGLIASISNQTNLLALNASIEAARAGEHGRGFAVVAEEVRSLAVQSEDASKKVARALGTVRTNTLQAVSMMNSGKQEVGKGKRSVQETSRQFQFIRSSVEEVAHQIQEITASSQQIADGSQAIAISTAASAKQAHEASALTQSVSAATEEQLAYMEEMTASAIALHAVASDLQSHIGRFKME
ncbi:methyl-accepting chemotaxis protein [Paenibacillus luteus]|uniref:methyl-accepting chemotaxis protein n=1 Tax=Paenibacillus luteus TaxID=2545753 RepID=UPI0013754A6B|nr:HAMP domain-containing methyl-accepting chemotaxis protein [Paenibacillus luteus]